MPHDPKSKKKVAWAYKYTIPLVQEGRITEKFLEMNAWFKNYNVPGQKYSENLQEGVFRYHPIRCRKRSEKLLSGRFGDYVEKKLMNFQIKRILRRKEVGDEMVATKLEIRLHPKKPL